MQFLNPWLALGLLAVSIPVIIHILTRQSGKSVDWGAILFLRDSLVIRNRQIHLEEALLMAARCLLLALLALALARPFIPPGSKIPWFLVLPMFLAGAVCLGVAVVFSDSKKWRFLLTLTALTLFGLCAALTVFEKVFNLSRFSKGGRQDIAIIIDASTSMGLNYQGRTNFERAVDEVRTIIKQSPRGNSFSLILGGPTPSARVLIPTADREQVARQLDDIRPLEGGMATYDCLTLASLGLAQGSNPAKQILMFTDGQNVGWGTDKPARWDFLQDALENLPSTPQVIVRDMPLPTNLRNLAVTEISYSREVVGIDRPVKISVTVANTGSEAVSPRQVELTLEGETLTDRTLGQILPGTEETLEFTHQFKSTGAHELSAKLLVDDEIEQDNVNGSVLNIVDKLKVLIVDGNPGGAFFDRAGSFAALALAPGPQVVARAQGPTGENGEGERRFLVDPEVVPAVELLTIPSLKEYDTIIMADVPRLTQELADRVEQYLQEGGGVLMAVGPRAADDFYNGWLDQNGAPFLPARLMKQVVPNPKDAPITPSLSTFRHPAAKAVVDRKESDFESAAFTHYWALDRAEAADSVIGGRLSNGDGYLAARKVGLGNLILLGSSLDLRAGNLPSRQSFVPLIHELVYFLANPGNYELNLDPKWELSLHLAGSEHAFAGHGLRGEYYAGHNEDKPKVERYDSTVQFNWRGGSPADGIPSDKFKVLWRGKLQAPRSGRYKFYGDVDDYVQVFVDGQNVLRGQDGKNIRSKDIWLDANQLHDFRVEYREDSGDARVILSWDSKELPRQIIPPEAFRSFNSDNDEVIAKYEVTGPAGERRQAVIQATTGGAMAKIQGDVSAGTYKIHVPDEERAKFGELLGENGDIIPFTVRRDPAESRLEPLTPKEREFLASYVGLVMPETPEDVVEILSGGSYGEELWKQLAVGALFFLLAETALSRWIARSRRTSEDHAVKFEQNSAGEAFKEQLAKVRKSA